MADPVRLKSYKIILFQNKIKHVLGNIKWKTWGESVNWLLGVGNRNANKQSQRPKVHLHSFHSTRLAPSSPLQQSQRPAGPGKQKDQKDVGNPFDEVNVGLVSSSHTHDSAHTGRESAL